MPKAMDTTAQARAPGSALQRVTRRRGACMAALACAALVIGCASRSDPTVSRDPAIDRACEALAPLPRLRLAPALLEREMSLSQRLTVTPLGDGNRAPQVVDVQLELDRDSLRLAAFALGQRVLLMQWDGRELKTQRHPRLPAEVDEQRMLRDMTLVYWPGAALSGALPPPWTLRESPGHRELLAGSPGAGSARAVVDVAVSGDLARDSRIVIVNEREHYRLLIESRPLESGR